MRIIHRYFSLVGMSVTLAMLASLAVAADVCKNRGELDTMYCDDNSDMVADVPADSKKFKNPSTIVFTYTPVEDPPSTRMSSSRSRRIRGVPQQEGRVLSGAVECSGDRGDALGPVARRWPDGADRFRGQLAGAVPFAVGPAKEFQGYN